MHPQSTRPTAIVTGAARGIGRAIVSKLHNDGMNMVAVDIAEAFPFEESESILIFRRTDIASEKEIKRIIKETTEKFGRIDLLVNNAAISLNKDIAGLSLSEWNRVIAVNLTAPFLLSREAFPYLSLNKGAIINIASTRAHMSEPGTEAYSASKGGILALTHSLALSFSGKVRVNAISPGWIDTRDKSEIRKNPLTENDHSQHPAGRVGRPEDIAGMVSFLTRAENDFITGAEFIIDGGMTRKMIYI